jgi:hypothetical protein
MYIVTIAMIVAVAPLVVVIVDPRGAWSTSERERVIVIAVALVLVSRVACVVAITRVEVEHRLPPRPVWLCAAHAASICSVAGQAHAEGFGRHGERHDGVKVGSIAFDRVGVLIDDPWSERWVRPECVQSVGIASFAGRPLIFGDETPAL